MYVLGWNFTQSHSCEFSTILPIFIEITYCFLKMAQKESRVLIIISTQPLRRMLLMLWFDDLKQQVSQVLTAIFDRTLTACNHATARCCRGCLINQVLDMSLEMFSLCFYTCLWSSAPRLPFSAVCAVLHLLLPALHFIDDPCTSVSILWSSTSIFSVIW